jgi:hypothetical protein
MRLPTFGRSVSKAVAVRTLPKGLEAEARTDGKGKVLVTLSQSRGPAIRPTRPGLYGRPTESLNLTRYWPNYGKGWDKTT